MSESSTPLFLQTPAAIAAQKHNSYVFQTDNAQIQTLNVRGDETAPVHLFSPGRVLEG